MRGDVVWVDLPSAVGRGSVQSGQRPAVVVSENPTTATLPVITIVPGTSSLVAATRFPLTVTVQPSQSNGLTSPTVFLAFQVQTVPKTALRRTAGQLSAADLQKVESSLRQALGL